jgi:hypothetical protein
MDIRILCCIGSLLLVTNSALSADIKRWVDKDGQVHFGDNAPHGTHTVQVTPEIITTAPSSNNSLKKIMRPGELRMIKNYEKREKRLIKAKRKALKQSKQNKKRLASAKKRCNYHRRKKDSLKRKLRQGYTPSEKIRIEERLTKHKLKIGEYCN